MSMQLGGGVQRAEINVTPLIDVLLVLLIIFLIAPKNVSHGEEAEVPQPATTAHEPPPERTVVVQVQTNGNDRASLSINRQPVAWERLALALKDIYKQRADKVLFVKGDHELAFENVAYVIGAAHQADSSIQVGLIADDSTGKY